MPKVNKTKYAILGVLSLKPGSGYDIKKFCDASISLFWNENYGHIYPVLKQMEKEGLVNKTIKQNPGNPPRHVYYISPAGRDRLNLWLSEPVEQTPARLELLLKLFFAKNVPAEIMVNELEKIKQRLVRVHNECLEKEKILEESPEAHDNNGYPYWLATVKYGVYDSQFKIKWCEETIESIKNYQATNNG